MILKRKIVSTAHLCRYQTLVLFIVFEILLFTCELNWILNSTSFLQYLVMMLQTKFSNFLSPFWLGITKNKSCSFPWNPTDWMTWYKLQRNCHNSSCLGNLLCVCCCLGHSEKFDGPPVLLHDYHQTFKLRIRRIWLPPLALHLKMLSAWHLELMSALTGGSQDSDIGL